MMETLDPTLIGITDTHTNLLHVGIKTNAKQTLAYAWGKPIRLANKGSFSRSVAATDKQRITVGDQQFTVDAASFKRHLEERHITDLTQDEGSTAYDTWSISETALEKCDEGHLLVDQLSAKHKKRVTRKFRKAILKQDEAAGLRLIEEGANTRQPFRWRKGLFGTKITSKPPTSRPVENKVHWQYGHPIAHALKHGLGQLARVLDGLHGHNGTKLYSYSKRHHKGFPVNCTHDIYGVAVKRSAARTSLVLLSGKDLPSSFSEELLRLTNRVPKPLSDLK